MNLDNILKDDEYGDGVYIGWRRVLFIVDKFMFEVVVDIVVFFLEVEVNLFGVKNLLFIEDIFFCNFFVIEIIS